MRSISHYCAHNKAISGTRISLGGGANTLPPEFFPGETAAAGRFFDPLRNLAVAQSAGLEEISRSRHLLGEPVGLALRAAIDCPSS